MQVRRRRAHRAREDEHRQREEPEQGLEAAKPSPAVVEIRAESLERCDPGKRDSAEQRIEREAMCATGVGYCGNRREQGRKDTTKH